MTFVLRKNMNIGAFSAEEDQRFLEECFIETDDIQILEDQDISTCIALGRTGSGKSALLLEVERRHENVIRIDPESLSLNFISNSNIIRVFEELGIKLDVFYQLLWRHIFTIELIKSKQEIHDSRQAKTWISTLFQRFNEDQRKVKALEYLFEFGNSFWADTEARVREVVRNIEQRFSDESGVDFSAGFMKYSDGQTFETANGVRITQDVIHKAQNVVNKVQIQELENVINVLAEDIFDDRYEVYYLIIDDLDKDWAHDDIRFKLIRALIETIKKFRKITNLKILISMRADLLQTVITKTSAVGFQREKYEDLFHSIQWDDQQLRDLAEKRINHLFKDQYTSKKVGLHDILANKVGQQEAFQYILDRTLNRPRDVISYLNECLKIGSGKSKISNKVVRDAELHYSRNRLESLTDEWREVYGNMEVAIRGLKKFGARFSVAMLDEDALGDFCLHIMDGQEDDMKARCFYHECVAYASNSLSADGLRDKLLTVFYNTASIGIKPNTTSRYEWSYKDNPVLDLHRLDESSKIVIHPMLYKALGVYADPKTIDQG